ncbi:polycystic kidney disease protein 1-like 2 [Biomphalaria glabrata]|uniref:Polycystic kidney disease protein 1-like 2 n=1 Tax=Biomphalaria glabrata TaxID=6526 RepID=A0A9W2ZN40_BIOGL|nr:polycystic kidney disease protein 1-like 2 [Biomphalaria glabrata]
MTSNQDIVNEGSRSSAAGAFMVLANGTSNMPEATVEDASSFAGECLGGLGNIFPKSPTTKPGQTVLTADETTTALLITLTTTRPGTTLAFSGNLTTPFSLVDSRNNASSYSTKSVTSPTAGLYQDTKATPMPTTTMTTVMNTPLTTVIHTTVGTTLSPTVGASFADNGDNFTISGVTVGTLQLNASKDYTTPQPFTTSTIGTTTPSTPESPVTLPIDNRMFEPRSDPRSPSQIAQELLRNLPDKDTYRELFFYIFSDCLLFRQVMKSPEIQYNIPCLSTDAINMMKCDGEFTLQDRVFDIMTYYEHPDDIYEVYLQPLDIAREARDKARKETDKTVANAGLTALSTVADSIGNKTHPEDTTERSFATPRLGMKLAKVSVDNSTNITDSSNNTQTMSLPTGGFDVPKSIFQGSASGCANVNTMFLADSDNPFTFADTDNNVGRGVLSLAYTCNGERINVSGTQEPIVLWMERDANMYQESLFVLITNTKTDVWSNFNYHPVNLTETNSSLQVILEPQDADSEYYVYLKFGERPNVTYYDYIGFSPNDEVTKLSGYQSLNDSQKQQLRYTVTFPLDLTSSNGTYWIAVKYKRGNIQLADTTANSSYTLLNLVSGCRFWDDENNTWSSEGCQVGPLTTKYRTQCLCNHLTSFGTDAVVAPNTIDFTNVWAKFDKLSENAAVFATVISLVCLYLILLIILRYFDKLDLIKWGAIPLEDNLPTDSYFYQVTVQTGVKRNAGTDSQVRFIVSGEEGDSGVRRLTVAEGKRKHLATGSIYNYVMSVDSCLGPLNFLRIWHDNSGKGKNQSWYLDQVQINDLQTGERFIFLCDRWLAVEEDDGLVDRILPVAGLDDLIAFKQLFSSSARKKLANDHLWVSVFSRPTRSNFTRVQRLSCCMSLLFLTMITNAMWFKGAETQTNVEAIKIGPLTFTLAQVFISFASTIIVFPPSFLMMTLFRKCEPKKNMVAQANQAQVKDNRKFRWRNISASTSQLWGSKPKESRIVQFKEKITQFINSFKKRKYQDVEPASSDRSDGQFLTPKKKKPFTFPHWCIYIAWTLCFLSILVSGFFTILYSMEWGTEKANQWLTTFLLSFFESVIIVQPIKVLLLVAFIACILKKPELEDEDLDEDINRVLVGKETADSKDEASLSQIMLQRRTDNSELQPPDPELLAKLRETRMMEIKMETVLKEIIVYMIFLVIIFFLSYQQRDPQSYAYNTNVRGVLLDKFDKIVTIQDYWTWLQENFLPAFYAQQYADGNDVRYWRDVACIADMESRRVGVARIRQLRIKNDTCSIQSELKSVINHCRDSYGWTADDTKPYLPFWETPADDMKKELEMSKSPFVYQDSIDLKTAPFVGNIATYKGGGYVILTRRTYGRTAAIVDKAKSENWVDLNTKAIFLEYTIYNPNVNLFTSVTALVEFLPTGSAVTMADVKVFRLMSYIGGFGVIVLVFEIFFGIVSIIFFVQCIKKVRVQRIAYFADFWNILEFVLLCLAVTCIVLYGFKHVLTDVAISALQNRKSDGFVNFNTIALYDELYGFVMSAVVFLATIQFLKLLQFNKKMGMLGATVKLASKDLYLFSITFFLYFFAFTATGFLLFCSQLTSYQNVVSTAEAMFAFALGSFDFNELSAAQPFWGPLFVFAYIGVVYIGLMSIFLTIIGESFSQVKENVALQSNDYELVEFIWTKIKVLFK